MTVIDAIVAGVGAISSIIIGLVLYIFGVQTKRIDIVEQKLENKLDKTEFEELLGLKLASVTDDVREIKDILYLLMEMRLKKGPSYRKAKKR